MEDLLCICALSYLFAYLPPYLPVYFNFYRHDILQLYNSLKSRDEELVRFRHSEQAVNGGWVPPGGAQNTSAAAVVASANGAAGAAAVPAVPTPSVAAGFSPSSPRGITRGEQAGQAVMARLSRRQVPMAPPLPPPPPPPPPPLPPVFPSQVIARGITRGGRVNYQAVARYSQHMDVHRQRAFERAMARRTAACVQVAQ